MSFSLVQATAKGRALLARAQIGGTINFTHIKMGDGQMTGQVIDEMLDLINIKKELDITGLKVLPGGKAKVLAAFSNKDLSTGFYWREVGVFATDPDNPGAEIMYCYGNAGALADYIPAGSGSQILETILSILTIVSNAANVTATIDQSNVYLTSQDAEETYIKKSLATAASQFLVSSAAGQWIIKTVAEIKSLLGLGSAAYTDSTAYATATQGTKADNAATQINFNSHLSDYVRQPGYGAVGGTTNAYTLTLDPAPTAYIDGMGIAIRINSTNTGASTINVNNLGAKPIVDSKGNALVSGKLLVSVIYSLKYCSTTSNFILQGEGRDTPKISNLCKNGSFENSFNCYDISTASPTILSTGSFIGSKCLKTTSSSVSPSYAYQDNIKVLATHKIYVTGMFYVENYTSGTKPGFNLYKSGTWDGVYTLDINVLLVNQWQRASFVATSAYDSLKLLIGRPDTGIETTRVDAVMLIDLTDVFGTGKEPSKEEMDYIVTQNGNWWDSDLQALTVDSTAVAANILNSKSAYANGQKVVGTMADHSGNNITASWAVSSSGQVALGIPQGYYDGLYSALANDSNFIPSNIPNGMSIFGLVGSNTNKKWISGASVSISGSQASFIRYDGATINSYYCTVTHNAGWQPSIIIVLGPASDNSTFTIFDTYASKTVASNIVTGSAVGFQNSGNLFSTVNAFQLPINNNTGTYSWIAYA